ncbi:somatoliberin isoform X2 [Oreochromis aureus]|uniref:Somatoliberin n=2 Tax=Oreochromis aureus TaxID=47969 RepID=A0AAZ1WWC7_OREAU|nr:somatoliberin isoform X2 [Oreochromis aureus]
MWSQRCLSRGVTPCFKYLTLMKPGKTFHSCEVLLHTRLAVMMEKAALLLCCLIMTLSGSPLYPAIRFGQRDTSILMTSSLKNPTEQQEEDARPPREPAELRLERHADAIFTNSYRKVLGQISARKFLQTIMGKRLGDGSESYMKRQSDIYEGTYKEDLTAIQRNQRHRGVHGNVLRPRLLS